MARKRSRSFLTGVAVIALAAVLTFAFWPRPTMVDIGEVTIDRMILTIDEEGRTRVHDAYVISTPVAGRLMRVDVEPGDAVERHKTVVAQMLPSNPAALDVRSREQARSAVAAAEAALRLARAELNRAIADKELADIDLERARTLRRSGTVSEAALDRAIREALAAQAAYDTAEAVIEMRQAELENARAQLIGFDDRPGLDAAIGEFGQSVPIPIRAPSGGRVLRLIQKSETTLPAGTPIMEIGNIDSDLEVLVELLSTDAVQVAPGDRVLIEKWGGSGTLNAVVQRVDPWGFTKFSALGVEEQRVNAIIRFVDSQSAQAGLGHGFRVEARIIVWEDDDALVVPSSALFRDGRSWSVFLVEDGIAQRRQVDIGHNNGIQAQVVNGLEPGDRVILYPASGLSDGMRVAQREIH
ncbi:HlyD family secretion protein [Modicisalibacter ilicicola DSM 19980]|uniref:HlyD family secretion protein n=1 Tax=Modicisalibacter ilicicola DSM 19980 TaxID=1121942 RepID=A0A1M4T783_9GAMM|nr:HlyD family efflux transporter periplasmic adaptor subunit [Halomonas ilicicola]SHE40117.1 HlyD family secretion protein [Halomonas ilicicola DSM 19980]